MEQNINTGTPMPEEKSSMTSIASIILIVVVLAAGAFYFFKQVPVPTEQTPATNTTPAQEQADATVSGLSAQGTSTDLTDIQKDLNATDLSGVDAGLSDIAI
jgi:flagellar basal body-associated protein FliL